MTDDIPAPFTSTAPGRLCLFGEHQDYLGLPVIAAALPLRCRIQVSPTKDSRILEMHMPTFAQTTWRCDLDSLPQSAHDQHNQPDFAMAAVLDAVSDGWSFVCGAKCVSTTDIPLQAGCSSSSAFCVAWIQALARLAGIDLTPLELAKRAHHAEVTHFGNPGGTMDHVTSALGRTLRIGPRKWHVEELPVLPPNYGCWILADSGQPKDTLGHLKRCKYDRLALLARLGGNWDAETTKHFSQDELRLLSATKTNTDTESTAATLWSSSSQNAPEELGAMMNRHHEALADGLGLSTTRLEDMRQAAMDAGAWGFKLVGSGGGGCGVAWVPTNLVDAVGEAMKDAGAIATWNVSVSSPSHGARIVEEKA